MEQQSNNFLKTLIKMRTPLVIGFIIGGLVDLFFWFSIWSQGRLSYAYYVSTYGYYPTIFNQISKGFFGFSLIISLVIWLLISLLDFFNVKSKAVILITSSFSIFFAMIFGFWFYQLRNGFVSDMYGLIYYVGAIPSLLIGLLFGMYLVLRLKKSGAI